ncbi:hypothetical protein PIB30_103470 [Stylosanthes scabra]|uniref:CCHC-type domain-containing protein n=1 Tax=Stylosanthes scabra TaxID=79078 RepID=A0ABU6YXM6_9FABA|nr:hypothetical protein [Stylosanthes scabra]
MEFLPIPDESLWPEWNEPTIRLNPAMRRKKKGYPVSTRIRNEMDMAEHAEKRCIMCRQEGHTRCGCPNAPRAKQIQLKHPRPGLHPELDDGGNEMMSHMGADANPSVASVPEDEQPDELMTLRRSGKMDQSGADDGVIAVTNSGNTGDEETVCDSATKADNAAEIEMATDTEAEVMSEERIGPEVMAAYITDAVMADDTVVVMADDTIAVMADNTENPNTAEKNHAGIEGVALAYIPGPRRA